MSTLDQAMLINGLVLFAVLEADLGPHRKIGLFRIMRPLLMSVTIIPLFIEDPATDGTGLTLEIAATVAGLLLGLAASGLTHVYLSPTTDRPVSRAGFGYALLWIVVIGARTAFSYGSEHWFRSELGDWMATNEVTTAAITDSLLLMAVAMTLGRTLTLAGRASATRRRALAPAA